MPVEQQYSIGGVGVELIWLHETTDDGEGAIRYDNTDNTSGNNDVNENGDVDKNDNSDDDNDENDATVMAMWWYNGNSVSSRV